MSLSVLIYYIRNFAVKLLVTILTLRLNQVSLNPQNICNSIRWLFHLHKCFIHQITFLNSQCLLILFRIVILLLLVTLCRYSQRVLILETIYFKWIDRRFNSVWLLIQWRVLTKRRFIDCFTSAVMHIGYTLLLGCWWLLIRTIIDSIIRSCTQSIYLELVFFPMQFSLRHLRRFWTKKQTNYNWLHQRCHINSYFLILRRQFFYHRRLLHYRIIQLILFRTSSHCGS